VYFCAEIKQRNVTVACSKGKGKGKVHPVTGNESPEVD
jgi:hypothetical protein